ncbi:DUF2663 family protein [Paenibacillus sp. GCM10027626]|uniref:DUF2663 family protein n=1 Tax=Paenibacillus sp. GCM10027626 TaxID=3273411 RepID=UPI003643969B
MDDIEKELEQLAVSSDTKILVKEMIARKTKADQLLLRSRMLAVINLFVAIVVLYWLYKLGAISSRDVFDSITYIGKSTASLLFVIVAVSVFLYSGTILRAYKKQEKQYEELRQEAVEKLRAKWELDAESQLRDELAQLLDRKGINIRFVN